MEEEKREEEEEKLRTLIEKLDKIDQDPEVRKLGEEYKQKYGTLTEEDLRKTFTI